MTHVRPAPALTAVALAVATVCAMAQTEEERAVQRIEITSKTLGKGEARANSVVDNETIQQLPAGEDPLRLLGRVPGLQASSSDALTGSFSMRLMMRGFTKEQIGFSVDGIPVGSTVSNGGTMPNRLLDQGNLDRVSVSQTAGEIGTPSNQALGGYIDFRTRDPLKSANTKFELAGGSYDFRRAFVRHDTGEFGPGLTAYFAASHSFVKTWPGDHAGRSRRDHAALRVKKEFDDGSSVRGTLAYTDLADNDYDAVALRAGSRFKGVFETNPDTDALTDAWTGDPFIDQNNRRTRGINSREVLGHIDVALKFGEMSWFTLKPYYHRQRGAGWFYVPRNDITETGLVYNAVPAPPAPQRPVRTAQECFAGQFVRTPSGALVPLNGAAQPPGVAAALANTGCSATSAFLMNPPAAWGARQATTRRGGNEMDRHGLLAEFKTGIGETHELRVGTWLEHIDRYKLRSWYTVIEPAVGPEFNESGLYAVTQDRHFASDSAMAYVQDRMLFLEDKLEVDVGLTYQQMTTRYTSPVEFFGERELEVKSGILPKVAALYRVSKQLEAFASASKNYSALPDFVFEGTDAVSVEGLKPENSINKDLGVRWLTGSYGVAVTVYDIDYRNRLSRQPGVPGGDVFNRDLTSSVTNQGGIISRGAEVTTRAALGSFELYGSYGYNESKYVEDTPLEGIRAGDPVLGAPRHNVFAEAVWKPSSAWRLAFNAKHVSKAAGTYHEVHNSVTGAPGGAPVIVGAPAVLPREYMPAYTLLGLSAGYKIRGPLFGGRFSDTEVILNVSNLTDKRYLGGVFHEVATLNPLTSGRYFLGSPRTFSLTLRTNL